VAVYDDWLVPAERSWRTDSLRTLKLKGHRIAYIRIVPTHVEEVVVRDLLTGHITPLHGDARERIMGLVLTDALVAFVTYTGLLYVHRLSDTSGKVNRFRLPSSQIVDFVGEGNKFALLVKSSGTDHNPLLVYSDSEQMLKPYRFPLQRVRLVNRMEQLPPQKILLDNKRDSIHVISYMHVSISPVGLCYQLFVGSMRFDLGSKEELEPSSYPFLACEPYNLVGFIDGFGLCSTGEGGEVRVWLTTLLLPSNPDPSVIGYRLQYSILYNMHTERLQLDHSTEFDDSKDSPLLALKSYMISPWRDIVYKISSLCPDFMWYLAADDMPASER